MHLAMFQQLRTTKKRLAAAEVARDAARQQLESARTQRKLALKRGWLVAQAALDVLLSDTEDEANATPSSNQLDPPDGKPAPDKPEPSLTETERKDVDRLIQWTTEADVVRSVLGSGRPQNAGDAKALVQQWGERAWWRTFFEWLIFGPHLGARVLFLAVMVTVPYLFHLSVDWLWLEGLTEWPNFAPTSLFGFVSTVLVALGQYRQWMARVAPGLVESLQDKEKLKARLDRFKGFQSRLKAVNESARAEVERHDCEVALARETVDRAESAILKAQTGWALDDFVGGVSGDRYRKHLGLMATINEDLDQLGKILSDLEESRKQAGRWAAQNIVDDTFVPTPAPRIVLFIDDLDRCPPARVVEVLEAIHLLLAKNLFAVVVAVDARWLLRSIDTHFQELIAERPEWPRGADGHTLGVATPRHYLEKIFQVPFQVPPMSDAGFDRLVADLVGPSTDAPVLKEQAADAKVQAPSTATPALNEGPTQHTDADATPAQPLPEDSTEVDLTEFLDDSIESSDTPAPALPSAARVRFHSAELSVLQALGPLVETPRTAKRLVNTARLVRLQSMAADWEDLCAPIMLLLGLDVGAPDLWTTLRTALADTDFAHPLTDLKRLACDGPHSPGGLKATLERLEATRTLPESPELWRIAMGLSERFAFVLDGGHTRVDG